MSRAPSRIGCTEAQAQRAVATYLDGLQKIGKLLWFHPAQESKRSARYGAELKRQGMKAGIPDAVVILPEGRTVWIELKSGKGRLSIWQQAVRDAMEQLAHEWHCIWCQDTRHAVAQVEAILKDAGVRV